MRWVFVLGCLALLSDCSAAHRTQPDQHAVAETRAGRPDAGPPDPEQILRDIQSSHIDANVPAAADFDNFLTRDLAAYFAAARKKKSPVQYELLRNGPTQSGVSYPKFYLWVRVAGGKTPRDRGAVRVAAVEKKQFEVTDFVSEEALRSDPTGIYRLFPAPVCEKITEKISP